MRARDQSPATKNIEPPRRTPPPSRQRTRVFKALSSPAISGAHSRIERLLMGPVLRKQRRHAATFPARSASAIAAATSFIARTRP